MTSFASLPQNLRAVSGPSSSGKSEFSRRYDYGGLDEHVKRQDAVAALRDEKFDALYKGDPAAAVKAGNRVRDLVAALKLNDPLATERNPVTVANPLVKVEAESGSSSSSSDSGGYQMVERQPQEPLDDAEPAVAKKRRNGVDGDPNRFANVG